MPSLPDGSRGILRPKPTRPALAPSMTSTWPSRLLQRCAKMCGSTQQCAMACDSVQWHEAMVCSGRVRNGSNDMQRYATVCNSVQWCAAVRYRSNGVQRYTTLCNDTLHNGVQRCASMQQCAIVCNDVQRCATVCNDMQRYAAVLNSVQGCAMVQNGE